MNQPKPINAHVVPQASVRGVPRSYNKNGHGKTDVVAVFLRLCRGNVLKCGVNSPCRVGYVFGSCLFWRHFFFCSQNTHPTPLP